MSALERLSEICAELPEPEREISGPHAGFKVRGRTFACYLDGHRGNEGIIGVVFKPPAPEGLIAASPERFYKTAYLHHRGWVGLRLDTGGVDWEEVADFVTDSYLPSPRSAWPPASNPKGGQAPLINLPLVGARPPCSIFRCKTRESEDSLRSKGARPPLIQPRGPGPLNRAVPRGGRRCRGPRSPPRGRHRGRT